MDERTGPELERALGGLARVAAPAGLTDAVMARVGQRLFLGLPARKWAVVGACFGAWAVAVQGIVGWTAASLGG